MPLIDPAVDTIGGRWYRVNKTTLATDGFGRTSSHSLSSARRI